MHNDCRSHEGCGNIGNNLPCHMTVEAGGLLSAPRCIGRKVTLAKPQGDMD